MYIINNCISFDNNNEINFRCFLHLVWSTRRNVILFVAEYMETKYALLLRKHPALVDYLVIKLTVCLVYSKVTEFNTLLPIFRSIYLNYKSRISWFSSNVLLSLVNFEAAGVLYISSVSGCFHFAYKRCWSSVLTLFNTRHVETLLKFTVCLHRRVVAAITFEKRSCNYGFKAGKHTRMNFFQPADILQTLNSEHSSWKLFLIRKWFLLVSL